MAQPFIHPAYGDWIQNNHGRFRYPPWMTGSTERRLILRFSGLAPELSFRLQGDGQATINIHDREVFNIHDTQGVLLDMIAEFDLYEEESSDGQYFCRLCDSPTRYPTRCALWAAHVFEPMLRWINDLRPGDWICVYGGGASEGCSGAVLIRAQTAEIDLERLRAHRDLLNSMLGLDKLDASQPTCKRRFPLVVQEDAATPNLTS